MPINDMRVCGCLLAKAACLCVYVFCHSCYWVWMCRRGGGGGAGMEEGREGAGVDVYVCRTMLLLLYDLVPKGVQEKRTEVLENKVDRM